MELPNYFIADLPDDHTVTPQLVTEACQTLKRNREQYLAGRSTASLVNIIAATAQGWLEPHNPFRRRALQRGATESGFNEVTLARGLDMFFAQLTAENLRALIEQDLGNADRLDRFGSDRLSAWALARGPELLAHIAPGNIPNPTILSIVLGFLTRSAQFVKCARGRSLLPRLFAHSIYEVEPKLASCLEIAEWPGGTEALEDALFAEAECVMATGSDETLAAIKRRLPAGVRFLGYGHRVSFGYITADVLGRFEVKAMIAAAAHDVVAWNQLGCLSPHVFYVEHCGLSAEKFAELLAHELAAIEAVEPRGSLPPAEAAEIASKRAIYEARAAATDETKLWQSEGSTAWTVVYEADPHFRLSSLNRFIYVKPVASLADALRGADIVRGKVSTVALGATGDKAQQLALELARWGVTRVCRVGRMQNPPVTWRHDGRPALADLVTWTDWES